MLPSIFIALVILGLYAVPGQEMSRMSFWDLLAADKIAHAGIFCLFSTSLMSAFRRQTRLSGLRARAKIFALSIAIVYGGGLEWVQGIAFIERTSDVVDFAMNGFGSFLGLFCFHVIFGPELAR